MYAHTVLTIEIGVPFVLNGRKCITPADFSIPVKIFDNLAFGAGKRLRREQFLEGGVEQLKNWVMSLPADNDLCKHFEWFVEYYNLSLMHVKPPVERIPRKKTCNCAMNKKYVQAIRFATKCILSLQSLNYFLVLTAISYNYSICSFELSFILKIYSFIFAQKSPLVN